MPPLFECLDGKKVVITGATGSFGRHISQALLRRGKLQGLTVFSRDEERQRQLGLKLGSFGNPFTVDFVLGDVRDLDSVRRATRGAEVIINAAALKQVPACELNALQAVMTNVNGMQNILDAARDQGVEQVLTISTDKAVQPINTMGMTKALQERLVQSHALRHSDPKVSVVRYGNVLGSTGSILPVFIDQFRGAGRLTVTDPEMTRFLLTLDDALHLVSTALDAAEQSGTMYVRHAPAVTVDDFATVLSDLFNHGEPIPRDVVGARPGDKAHEVLVSEDEMRRSSRRGNYFVIPPITPTDQPGAGGQAPPAAEAAEQFSSDVAPRMPLEELRALIRAWCAEHGVKLP